MAEHIPVLLAEVLEGLAIRTDGLYIDATFGRGGHSAAILERLGPAGRLLAVDRDADAVAYGRERFSGDRRFRIERGNFSGLGAIAVRHGFGGRTDGILFDLGVSSPQLDEADRGFSFMQDGPLDMRMDRDEGRSAGDWLDQVSERELRDVLKTYGEEKQAARIARAILRAREAGSIRRTRQLAEIVESVQGRRRPGDRHPATKTFQAIRIRINRELEAITDALSQVREILAPGGRLAVISFHSLEDRIVKRFMRDAALDDPRYRGLPEVPREARAWLRVAGKARTAAAAEAAANPRARSARLRVAEKLS
ncbi:MAG: 16S rRNA (cytosine(1402)-N(4))-methyltransferase RsmH [Gammaproteobacteria bacterium]